MASFVRQIEDRQVLVDLWFSMPVVSNHANYDPIWCESKGLVDTGANVSGVSIPATLNTIDSVNERGTISPFRLHKKQ